jgi:histidine triad (HIT) family protein
VVKAFDAQGATILNYCEPAGGQTVFHTHVHVIPRFDGVPLSAPTGAMADPDQLSDDAFKIRSVLGGAA